VSAPSCATKPSASFKCASPNAFTLEEAKAEIELSARETLLGCFEIPKRRLLEIPTHAETFVIAVSEIALRACVVLLGRRPKPLCSRPQVLDHSVAVAESQCQVELRFNVSGLCGGRIPTHRKARTPSNAVAKIVRGAEVERGANVSGSGSRSPVQDGLFRASPFNRSAESRSVSKAKGCLGVAGLG
jgi:hypothetical protein